MRTVCTIWNTRVAPVFDVAGQAIMVDSEDGIRLDERLLDLPGGSVLEKVEFLAAAKTDLLICGAISRTAHCAAIAWGIQVQPFIAGDVREVLQAWLEGKMTGSAFAMPGCRRGQDCRGKNGGRGGKRRGRFTG
jgi:predicted Fe-Mo cluster-binding NifX family protein